MLISARFDPAARKKLAKHAEENNRSVSAEIEARVEATLGLDDQGLELISRIGTEIVALQRRNNGKRWHVDLTGWASVAELLAEGPIHEMMPENEVDRAVQMEAADPVILVDRQRQELARQLANIGIVVNHERKLLGLLRLPNRPQERAAINSIPDDDVKATAIALHAELERLDEAYEERLQGYRQAMESYYEAEDAGRQICREYLYEEARRKQDAGERFNWSHLLRLYQSWR